MKTIEAEHGISIKRACIEAKRVACIENLGAVRLVFNDIEIFVRQTSNITDLCVIYDLRCLVRAMKPALQ